MIDSQGISLCFFISDLFSQLFCLLPNLLILNLMKKPETCALS